MLVCTSQEYELILRWWNFSKNNPYQVETNFNWSGQKIDRINTEIKISLYQLYLKNKHFW